MDPTEQVEHHRILFAPVPSQEHRHVFATFYSLLYIQSLMIRCSFVSAGLSNYLFYRGIAARLGTTVTTHYSYWREKHLRQPHRHTCIIICVQNLANKK